MPAGGWAAILCLRLTPSPFSTQIFLLEQEKQRLLLASDKVDNSMREYRERINAGRLDRMARNRAFENLRTELDDVKAELVSHIESSNELVDEKEQVRALSVPCFSFAVAVLLSLPLPRMQLDKVREVKLKESEDSIIDFEAQYQALVQEALDLQERYRSKNPLEYPPHASSTLCVVRAC